jgi:hypothetical protein
VAALSGRVGVDFRIGRVLGRSLGICGRHVIPFTLLCLLASLPAFAPRLFAGSHVPTPTQALRLLPLTLTTLITIPLSFSVVLLISLQDLGGQAENLVGAARQALARYLPLLACTLCGILAIVGGMILLVIPGIIVAIVLSVSGQVCVAERVGPIASLSRSAALTKGNRWRIFGLMLLVFLISGGIALAARPMQTHLGTVGVIIAYVATGVAEAFKNTVYAVQFYDLRVAKEGIGTERIAAVFD